MELHQVRYLLAVHEARNFTRAAERCNVSQPALTAAIRKLEEELNGQLLCRDRAGAKLTPLGEALLPRFQRLLSEVHAINEVATSHALLKGAPLRVAVLKTIGPTFLARHIDAFRKAAPDAELEIRVLDHLTLWKMLEEAEVDVAIGSAPASPPPWLVAKRLYEERYMVALPANHTLLERDTLTLRDLHGQFYIDRLACELRETLARTCEQADVQLYASYRTEQEAWIECLVRAGVGLALLPEFSFISPETARRALEAPRITRTICLLRSADHAQSPVSRVFWDTMLGAALAKSSHPE